MINYSDLSGLYGFVIAPIGALIFHIATKYFECRKFEALCNVQIAISRQSLEFDEKKRSKSSRKKRKRKF